MKRKRCDISNAENNTDWKWKWNRITKNDRYPCATESSVLCIYAEKKVKSEWQKKDETAGAQTL